MMTNNEASATRARASSARRLKCVEKNLRTRGPQLHPPTHVAAVRARLRVLLDLVLRRPPQRGRFTSASMRIAEAEDSVPISSTRARNWPRAQQALEDLALLRACSSSTRSAHASIAASAERAVGGDARSFASTKSSMSAACHSCIIAGAGGGGSGAPAAYRTFT